MVKIKGFELFAVDIPFKKPFKHAAADRNTSYSILLKCITESGHVGFGECLPREYVTGETREGTFQLLQTRILPRLVEEGFDSFNHLITFLTECNGKAPGEWVSPATPQCAAWAAVDLALLDAFGHEFNQPVRLNENRKPDPDFRYSVVFSAEKGFKFLRNLLIARLYGFRQVKLKVDTTTAVDTGRLARRILGKRRDIRADANMAWDVSQAREAMQSLARVGITSFEQPIKAVDLSGLAELVRDTGLGVMADESLSDNASLEALIAHHASTAVNVRISKCGGLVASYNRCLRALEAGLIVQVGCQVGETSLLSAAQLILITAVQQVTYGEGCFGLHLLKEDPVEPLMQFGYGGRPPQLPQESGLGIKVNEAMLSQWCINKTRIE
jgi:muconate cycloisomerase